MTHASRPKIGIRLLLASVLLLGVLLPVHGGSERRGEFGPEVAKVTLKVVSAGIALPSV